MQHHDTFMGFKSSGNSYPTMHIGYMCFAYMLSTRGKDILSPAPNPDFVLLVNDFFWLHLAFSVAFFILILKLRKEILIFVVLLSNFSYIYLFIEACVGHIKYNHKMGYSLFQVEDTVHFFVVIEIATYGTNVLVLMIYSLLASFRNERQVRRAGPINDGNDDGFVRQPG
jgi:hypothetical protein